MSPFAGGLVTARELLTQRFGHPAFRVHQLKVLGPLLAGRSVLAVLPTGAGKSLCYQLPALMAGGLTLVVSPLISLMQDQVAALRRRGIPAAYLNSLLSAGERRAILDAALSGSLALLYCAPERLGSLVRQLSRAGRQVSLLAVDEAHCIVEWGNEFRPVYRRLDRYRYLLGDPVTIALTGSAARGPRAEILRVLRIPQAEVVVTSFDRPNLVFCVERVRDDRERFARMRELIRGVDGPVIVYTPTRRLTELVARALLRLGVRAAPYHAGLTARTRRQVLRAFLADRAPVVVATSAFGMGIDKPDVRRVLHWGPPRTVEAYYQEAGRAGRDGRRAMNRAMEDHRSSAFPELATGLFRDLRKVFKTTTGQAFIFPATGTGGWEAALVNTLSPGDRVLAPRYGQFSHLWIDLAQRHGLRVDIIDVEWGEGAPSDRIGEILAQDQQHEIKGILIVHNETATGVTSDVAAVRSAIDAAQHPALLYVDGVSSIGSIDFRMDEWKVDLAITGSQKGLMLPAGLGLVCASPKAPAAREHAKCPRVFFDFGDMIKANATGYFPYTPSIPLLYGLRESLAMLFEEGLDQVFARHHRLADGVRAAVRAWGLKLCARAPKWHSDTVSAILVPEGCNAADVIDVAFRRYNLALGAGLARLAGKLYRIGHLGDLNELMLLGAIAGAEMAMRDVGIPVTPGAGVAAAAEHYRSTAAPLAPRAAAGQSADR